MRCILDPCVDLDHAMAKGWPKWMPLALAQADPYVRVKLGRWLLNDHNGGGAAIVSASNAARIRLAFLPVSDAVHLMRFGAAWAGYPTITGHLLRKDIVAARGALGEGAFAFAFEAALMPRPTVELLSAIGASDLPSEPNALLRCGATMFGLAMGSMPDALQLRLRLRHPASIWRVAADASLADSVGEDAFRALRRLIRKAMPKWSHWFN